MVKALLFDVQGTATDFHSTICEEARRISRDPGVDWSDVVRRWRAGCSVALDAARNHHSGWVSRASSAAEGQRCACADPVSG